MFRRLLVLCLPGLAVTASAQDRGGWPDLLRFGLIPVEGSADANERFEPLEAHLEDTLGVPVELDVGADYAAVIIAMASKQLDLAWFGPDSYVQAAVQAGAEAFVVEDTRVSGTSYRGVVIANSRSELTTLEDAVGLSFAFTDPNSTSGYLVPEAHFLSAYGVPATGYFADVVYSGTHEASLLGVLNNTLDVAATSTLALDQLYDKGAATPGDFRVLWTSAPIPGFPVAYRGDLPASLKAALEAAFLSFDDPAGLELLGLERYARTDDAAYNGIREIIAAVDAATR